MLLDEIDRQKELSQLAKIQLQEIEKGSDYIAHLLDLLHQRKEYFIFSA